MGEGFENRRVLAIHDLSGAGKCSLTVVLPVLSALGCEVTVLPTAALSTHT
ncbi:MAG: pyridoxal kinase, partial [Acutalibacteraceae bacterium]